MFGLRNETDRLSHTMGTAFGWGAATAEAASGTSVQPESNDGQTAYELTVPPIEDVPVNQTNGFWR